MSQDYPIFGLGFRAKHYSDLLTSGQKDVNFLEIMTENYLHHGRAKKTFLDDLAEKWPLSLHGVGLSIGGLDPLNLSYLESLDILAKRLRPKFVTDHLCWTSFRGHNTHDLLPVPYTDESLKHVISRVQQVQDRLGQRLYLENPSAYTAFLTSTIEEAEFLACLTKESGCGILLDVNNLYVVHHNLGIDPGLYLAKLDPSSIAYLHMAGHTDRGDILIDTHDHPVTDDVMELYGSVIRLFPKAPTILEWDGEVPPYSAVINHLNNIKQYRQRSASLPDSEYLNSKTAAWHVRHHYLNTTHTEALEVTQKKFFHLITSVEPSHTTEDATRSLLDLTVPTPAILGIKVYRDAYWVRLIKVIRDTYPCLSSLIGTKKFSEIICKYLVDYPPHEPDIKFAGQHLASFLLKHPTFSDVDAPYQVLADIAALEWAKYDALDDCDPVVGISSIHLRNVTAEAWPHLTVNFNPQIRVVKSDWTIGQVLEEFASGKTPAKPSKLKSAYLVLKKDDDVEISSPAWLEFRLFEKLKDGLPFEKAMLSCHGGGLTEDDVCQGVTWLSEWCSSGLVTSLRHDHPEIQRQTNS